MITLALDRTEQDSISLNFYDNEGSLLVELQGQYYKLVKGCIDVKERIEYAFRNY